MVDEAIDRRPLTPPPTPVGPSTVADLLHERAEKIKAAHREVMDATGRIVHYAIIAGEHLRFVKEDLDHGQWLPWLQHHCLLDERTAQRYMRLAKAKAEGKINPTSASDFKSLSQAYRLLADPPNKTKISDADKSVKANDRLASLQVCRRRHCSRQNQSGGNQSPMRSSERRSAQRFRQDFQAKNNFTTKFYTPAGLN